MNEDLINRITYYLSSGGLFNPELADHLAVRNLLIECREALAQPEHIGFMDSKLNPIHRTWVGLTPSCPKGLLEYHCDIEGVDVVCFLDFTPEEFGSRDHYGLPNEPDYPETMELVNAYVKGTDVDIGHLLMQSLVDELTTQALEDFKNDDL
jgi:hypothetical protein